MKLFVIPECSGIPLTGLATVENSRYWVFRGNRVSFNSFCQLTGLRGRRKLGVFMLYGHLAP